MSGSSKGIEASQFGGKRVNSGRQELTNGSGGGEGVRGPQKRGEPVDNLLSSCSVRGWEGSRRRFERR